MSAHRYWRVRAYNGTYGLNNSLACATLTLRVDINGADLAPDGTAIASSYNANYPDGNATDNDAATFWSTYTTGAPTGGHWIGVDFGVSTTHDIGEFEFTTRSDSFRFDPKALYLEWSDNAATWNTSYDTGALSAWTAGETRIWEPHPVASTNPGFFFIDQPITGPFNLKWRVKKSEDRFYGGLCTYDPSAFLPDTGGASDFRLGIGTKIEAAGTTVNLDALVNAGTNLATVPNVTITGFNPADNISISTPAGKLYSSVYNSYLNGGNWRVYFTVWRDGNTATAQTFAGPTASTAEAARAGFTGATITGGSSYTFMIYDDIVPDNLGGVSLQIGNAPATSAIYCSSNYDFNLGLSSEELAKLGTPVADGEYSINYDGDIVDYFANGLLIHSYPFNKSLAGEKFWAIFNLLNSTSEIYDIRWESGSRGIATEFPVNFMDGPLRKFFVPSTTTTQDFNAVGWETYAPLIAGGNNSGVIKSEPQIGSGAISAQVYAISGPGVDATSAYGVIGMDIGSNGYSATIRFYSDGSAKVYTTLGGASGLKFTTTWVEGDLFYVRKNFDNVSIVKNRIEVYNELCSSTLNTYQGYIQFGGHTSAFYNLRLDSDANSTQTTNQRAILPVVTGTIPAEFIVDEFGNLMYVEVF